VLISSKKALRRVRPHEVHDSNGPALCSALSAWGYTQTTHQVVPDDPKAVAARLRRLAGKHEVIILSGGVSVGKYDFVPEALEHVGAHIHFHGVAIRPGKPLLYATLSNNRHIFGLPGSERAALENLQAILPALSHGLLKLRGDTSDCALPPTPQHR